MKTGRIVGQSRYCNVRPEQPNIQFCTLGPGPVKRILLLFYHLGPFCWKFSTTRSVSCARCPRLRQHSAEIAQLKRRAYRDETYWGRPVPSFGDPAARVLILGLAPGAHGSNRTGRMFTGDRSGEILYRVLHKTGFASQPTSVSRQDGLTLTDLYITAAAHCAPPGNKPTPDELRNCRPYFERELDLLPNLKVIVALGKIAFDIYLDILKSRGEISQPRAFCLRP